MGAARRAMTFTRLSAVKPIRSTAISISLRRMSSAISWSVLPRTSTKCSNAFLSRCRIGELRSVVPFEHAGQQIGYRAFVEIIREIGNANTIVTIGLAAPNIRKRRLVLHIASGALQLVGGR